MYRYPAQEHVGGDSKIPSILYYDTEGRVTAVRDTVINTSAKYSYPALHIPSR
jgi:hypothetical protein